MINLRRFTRSPRWLAHAARCREAAPLDELGAVLGRAQQRREIRNLSPFADWPNVGVSSKMLTKWRVGLTLGLGRSLIARGRSPMCGQVTSPALGLGAGGRSPGYLMPPQLAPRASHARGRLPYAASVGATRIARSRETVVVRGQYRLTPGIASATSKARAHSPRHGLYESNVGRILRSGSTLPISDPSFPTTTVGELHTHGRSPGIRRKHSPKTPPRQ
jgi:hypothetical protein